MELFAGPVDGLAVNLLRRSMVVTLAAVLGACQMPQPMPTGPSMPMPSGGASGSAGQSSPSGSQPPSGSAGGPSGSSGQSMPSGSSGPSGSSSPGGGADGSSGGSPPLGGGEPLPWPGQDTGGSAGGSVGDLDDQLDESLGDFDETVMGDGAGAGSEEEVDILNPLGGGSSGQQGDTPLYEDGESGDAGGPYEDEGIAQRAAEGGADGSSGGESGSESTGEQSGGGNSGGGASAPQGDASRTASGGSNQGSEDIVPIPDDIGDGRNDDVVLRQIREAAMQEQDPVLREKLWDEYRRIRGSR